MTKGDRPSLVRFKELQGRLPFIRSPLLQISLVEYTQSHYLTATPHTSSTRQ
jgi:hypothetical protein